MANHANHKLKRPDQRCIVVAGLFSGLFSIVGCTRDAGSSGADVAADTTPIPCGSQAPIDYAAELLIRDVKIVEDPLRTQWSGNVNPVDDNDGAWSFGRLFADIAREPDADGDASDHCIAKGCSTSYQPHPTPSYVLAWLMDWESDHLINCDDVPPRDAIETDVIDPWPKLANGDLDLTRAPFRLLAIVRRPDLVDMAPPGTDVNDCVTFVRDPRGAGELRFVFGLIDPSTGAPKNFTVIFEYNVPSNTIDVANSELQRWHSLASFTFGSDAYLTQLATLTREITRDGGAYNWPRNTGDAPCNTAGRQHDNNLHRLRTQDRLLASPSQFRQFEIAEESAANGLGRFYLTDSPMEKFRQDPRLALFIEDNCADIELEHFKVGQEFPTCEGDCTKSCSNENFFIAQFQAGQLSNEQTVDEVWNAGNDDMTVSCPGGQDQEPLMGDLRHLFARNTCNGCHGIETQMNAHDGLAAQPFHIMPRAAGQPAQVSRLLQGPYNFVDPLGNARMLDERGQRISDYENAVCTNGE